MAADRSIQLAVTLKQLIEDGGYRGNRQKVASAVGVSAGALSQYVNDQSNPSLEKLVALANFFGVSLDHLVFGESGLSRMVSPPDLGPVTAFIDQSLANVQQRVAAQVATASRIGQLLAEQIDAAARRVADESLAFAGMLTDDETLAIEAHSTDTTIVSLNLAYDVTESDGEDTPGRFLPTVANNIAAGRRYKYLLPHDVRDWTPVASKLRRLLSQMSGAPVPPGQLQIRQAVDAIYTPIGICNVDVKNLEAARPILTERVRPYMNATGMLGYVIPASPDQLGDSLMDRDTLEQASRVIAKIWQRAKSI